MFFVVQILVIPLQNDDTNLDEIQAPEPIPPPEPSQPSRWLLVIGPAFELGLGGLALVIAWFLDRHVFETLHWKLSDVGLGILAALPMLVVLVILWRAPGKPFQDLRHLVDHHFRPMFRGARWFDLALIAAAAGWGEEVLFRGLLQPWLSGLLGVIAGIALTNLFFGLLHPFSALYIIWAAGVGVYLSGLLLITDNLLVPMIVHGFYDFLALFWLVCLRRV